MARTKKDETDRKVLHTYTSLLPCELTDDEVRDRGRALAATIADIKTEESRSDSIKQEMKSRMSALESKLTALATQVERGEEVRDVVVEDIADYDMNRVIRVRTDTGVIISERPILDEERQESLPLGAAH